MSTGPELFEELGGWTGIIGRLVVGESLSARETAAACAEILRGGATPAQIAAYAVALRSKGETVDEMTGMLDAMYQFAEPLEFAEPDLDGPVVDTCGTGGDRSGSINVSTVAAFIAAGAGAIVCKHGGRAASSRAGSADVLEELGVVIDLGPEGVLRCMHEVGMGFCFAPRFHPAMRNAAPVRRELGIPTIFNYLGPLANPCHVRRQVIGVSDASMAPKMIGVLQRSRCVRAMVVHGDDGLDEITTTARTTVMDLRVAPVSDGVGGDGEGVRVGGGGGDVHVDGDDGGDSERARAAVETWSLRPDDVGIPVSQPSELVGGDAAENARLLRMVLDGGQGALRDISVLNAAAAIVVAGLVEDLESGTAMARESVDSGRARRVLDRLVEVSQEVRSQG